MPSRCSRKTTLALFVTFELLAFIASLIALLSPAWQDVYLQEYRSEHWHGLWLDCKMDYAQDYGRGREFAETLYRYNDAWSLDFFWLPIRCIYKFDYYIDPEDLYDHNHDENRIQGDAYQHLFLGWKVAVLSALCVSFLACSIALFISTCAFCHRSLICASTVLATVATFFAIVGDIVFYIWANYQDNNILKEEKETYEQYFGWAFYLQLVATVLHILASISGCLATSINFYKSKSKLIKIEVIDSEPLLLDDLSSSHQQPFKRSYSAIYKVDSSALRQWEEEFRRSKKYQRSDFKRTNSEPNLNKKMSKKFNASELYLAPESLMTRSTDTGGPHIGDSDNSGLKIVPQQHNLFDVDIGAGNERCDLTYEVVPCDRRQPPSFATIDSSIKLESFAVPTGGSSVKYQHSSSQEKSIPIRVDPPRLPHMPPPKPPLKPCLKRLDPSEKYDTDQDKIYDQVPYDQEPIISNYQQQLFGNNYQQTYEIPISKMTNSTNPTSTSSSTSNYDGNALVPSSESDNYQHRSIGAESFSSSVYPHRQNGSTKSYDPPKSTDIDDPGVTLERPKTADPYSLPNRQQLLPTTKTTTRDRITEEKVLSTVRHIALRPPPVRHNPTTIDAFERPDSIDIGSLNSETLPPPSSGLVVHLLPDELERSVGGSTFAYDGDAASVITSPADFFRQTELRLNLFLNDQNSMPINNDTSIASSNETTV